MDLALKGATLLVLLDNTVLSNFARVGRPDLVLRLWASAACTISSVLGEYEDGVALGILPAGAWASLPLVTLSADETTAAALPAGLGAGERTCLAVAVHRGGILATDDLRARKVAGQRGVTVIGTVGILGQLARRGHLARDEANALLAGMIATGYHGPVSTLDALLDTEAGTPDG
jgi:predicted nucleic acid-binding protein